MCTKFQPILLKIELVANRQSLPTPCILYICALAYPVEGGSVLEEEEDARDSQVRTSYYITVSALAYVRTGEVVY